MMAHNEEDRHTTTGGWGWKHVQILLLFFGMVAGYGLRVCLSVAIVAMKDKHSANPDFEDYDWAVSKSGLILGAFFWGYVLMQIPSSYIATYWSAKNLLACGILICSVFSGLTPIAADYGYVPVIVCRVIMGLAQACLMPCAHTLLSRWVPPMERARLGSMVMNGPNFGTVLAMPISGYLASSSLGWPSVFYVFGVVGLVWSVIFFIIGADYPSEAQKLVKDSNKPNINQKPKVPWTAILTSTPMWALVIVHCGHNWGFYTLLTQLPSYMKSVLKYDISKSGEVSALPYLAMWLLAFPISFVADFALSMGTSISVARKACNTIGLWIPALSMLALAIVETDNNVVIIAILVVAVGFNSGVSCGFQINHIDLSPNFAGQMMSITNGLANILGIVAPFIVKVIVTDESNADQWHTVFYITAAIYFITNLVFIIMGKGDIQPWDGSDDPSNNYKSRPRLSVISIASEPTTVAMPDSIDEDQYKTHC